MGEAHHCNDIVLAISGVLIVAQSRVNVLDFYFRNASHCLRFNTNLAQMEGISSFLFYEAGAHDVC